MIGNSYQQQKELEKERESATPCTFATVADIFEDGLTLIFDGEKEPSKKHYRCAKNVVFQSNDRVYLVKDRGTYVAVCVVLVVESGLGEGIRYWDGTFTFSDNIPKIKVVGINVRRIVGAANAQVSIPTQSDMTENIGQIKIGGIKVRGLSAEPLITLVNEE